jgi:manganese-dependent inorganic pyrophosphatase
MEPGFVRDEKGKCTMQNQPAVVVTGHQSPDTDAIASAIAYAWLYNALAGAEVARPIALGAIGAQTAFVLDRFAVPAPPIVADAAALPEPRRVILVDHNAPEQSLPGMTGAELLEIVDHHRLSTFNTPLPVRVQIEPVGCCATLIAERAWAHGLTPPPAIAGLLLSAILSDTLVFKSPTSTPREEEAARRLVVQAGLAADDAAPEAVSAAIAEYGAALLASGGGIGTRPAEELVQSDMKFFEEAGVRFSIAQVEVTSFADLPGRLGELQAALGAAAAESGVPLALVMITDVVMGSTRLLAAGEARFIAALPYATLPDGTLDAPGVMSRKKQLLPVVIDALTAAAQG